jgi:hypothetical protein
MFHSSRRTGNSSAPRSASEWSSLGLSAATEGPPAARNDCGGAARLAAHGLGKSCSQSQGSPADETSFSLTNITAAICATINYESQRVDDARSLGLLDANVAPRAIAATAGTSCLSTPKHLDKLVLMSQTELKPGDQFCGGLVGPGWRRSQKSSGKKELLEAPSWRFLQGRAWIFHFQDGIQLRGDAGDGSRRGVPSSWTDSSRC